MAIYGIAVGVEEVRRAIKVDPISVAGFGVFIAAFAGLLSLGQSVPYLTGLWAYFQIGDSKIAISTPLVFDIGVYLAVVGTISAVALALEEDEEGK